MSKPGSARVPGRTQGDAARAPKAWQRPRAEEAGSAAAAAAAAPDNRAIALVLRGPLDARKLTAALEEMPLRYAQLRRRTLAVVTSEENSAAPKLPVTFTDLSAAADAQPPILSLAREQLRCDVGFSDRSQPLARASLLRLAPERHLLCVAAAEAACDPATLGVLMRDLGRCYSARLRGEQPPGPLPVRATDSAPAVKRQARGERQERQPKPPIEILPFSVPEALAASVARLAARLQVAELTVYFAAYALLLARMTGRPSVRLAVDRADLAAAVLPMLRGMHGETASTCVAIDTLASGERLVKDMQALGRTLAVACAPTDAVEHPAGAPASGEPAAGFRCGVRLTRETIEFAGLAVETLPVAAARDPAGLELALAYDAQGLAGEWRHDPRGIEAATVRGWLACYRTLLRSLAVESDSPLALLELLPDEQLRLMHGWNAAAAPGSARSVEELVALAAGRSPDRIALRDEAAVVTWRELESRSNRLARHLATRGAAPGLRVGVLMHPGVDQVVTHLAVLKTGAACLPLDPHLPDPALKALLQAGAGNLVVATEWAGDRPPVPLVLLREEAADIDRQADAAPTPSASPAFGEEPLFVVRREVDGAAHVVVLPRRAVASAVRALGTILALGARDTLLAAEPLDNGGYGLDVLAALGCGAQVRFVAPSPSPQVLRSLLEEGEVTAMAAAAGRWRELVDGTWQARPGFKAMLPAIEADPRLVADLLARGAQVCCLYGSTEVAGMAAALKLEHAEQLALLGRSDVAGGIAGADGAGAGAGESEGDGHAGGGTRRILGRPQGISAVWVCDEHGQPCPIGVVGELHVGGECVASGYLGERPLTAHRFLPDALGAKSGRKLFRTGELGRWRHDGLLEYLGRHAVPAVAGVVAAAAAMEPREGLRPIEEAGMTESAPAAGIESAPSEATAAPAPVVQATRVAPAVPASSTTVDLPLYAYDRSDGLIQDPPILAPDDPVMRTAWQQVKPLVDRDEGKEATLATARRAVAMHYAVAVAAGLVVGLGLTLLLNGERLLEMVFVAGVESVIGGEEKVASSSRSVEATAEDATPRPIVELPNPVPVREVTSLAGDAAQSRKGGSESAKVVAPAKGVEPAPGVEPAKVAEPAGAGPAKVAAPAKAVEPVKVVEPAKVVEQPEAIEPAKVVEPAKFVEQSKIAEQSRVAEQSKVAEQPKVVEPAKVAVPVKAVEPVKAAEASGARESSKPIEAVRPAVSRAAGASTASGAATASALPSLNDLAMPPDVARSDEVEKPVGSTKSVDTPTSIESAKPVEAARSVEASKTLDLPRPIDSPKPVDVAKTQPASKAAEAATTEAAPMVRAAEDRVVPSQAVVPPQAAATPAPTRASPSIIPPVAVQPAQDSPPAKVAPPPVKVAPPAPVTPPVQVAQPAHEPPTTITSPPAAATPPTTPPTTPTAPAAHVTQASPPSNAGPAAAAECRRELVVLGLCGKLP